LQGGASTESRNSRGFSQKPFATQDKYPKLGLTGRSVENAFMDTLVQYEIGFYWLWWLFFIAIGFCMARYLGGRGIFGAAILISFLILCIEVNSVFKDMRAHMEGRDADFVFWFGVLVRIVLYNIFVLPFSILGWKQRARRKQLAHDKKLGDSSL
jgi:hypothetical protein